MLAVGCCHRPYCTREEALTVDGLQSRSIRVLAEPAGVSGVGSQLNLLDLCECEQSIADSTGGLGCDKEGWFVSSFERVGTWVSGP